LRYSIREGLLLCRGFQIARKRQRGRGNQVALLCSCLSTRKKEKKEKKKGRRKK